MIKLEELHNQVIEHVKKGEFAQGIDDRGEGNGTVLYEVHMIWDHTDLGRVDIQQTVVEKWKNSKIESFRYYGDFG